MLTVKKRREWYSRRALLLGRRIAKCGSSIAYDNNTARDSIELNDEFYPKEVVFEMYAITRSFSVALLRNINAYFKDVSSVIGGRITTSSIFLAKVKSLSLMPETECVINLTITLA